MGSPQERLLLPRMHTYHNHEGHKLVTWRREDKNNQVQTSPSTITWGSYTSKMQLVSFQSLWVCAPMMFAIHARFVQSTFLKYHSRLLTLSWVLLTCSMLISKGPTDWHSGQDPGFTSWFWDWQKGPKMKLHLLQLYLTKLSWGRTPVQLVTTPLVRISWFKCSCL